MPELPPIPSWDALHPIVIHFPVALLLVSPLFLILGLLLREKGTCFRLTALILMALGAVSALVAVESGEAAAELVTRTPEVAPVLHQHAEMAEVVLVLFAVLSVIYALLSLIPALRGKPLRPVVHYVLHALFLVAYLGASLYLASQAHLGGRLVHELGVQALM